MTGTYRQALAWLRADWDRAAGIVLIVAGGIALFVGYQGVADSAFVVEALSYIASGGLVGVLLVAGGLTLLLSADLHDEWRKLDRIEAAIRSLSAQSEIVLPEFATEQTASSRRWRRRSVAALGLFALLCGGALVLAWDGVASAAEPGDAFESAASASTAVVLYGTVAVGLLVVQRARNAARRQRLLNPFNVLPRSDTRPADGGQVYVGPGLGRYHRAGCPALAGVTRAVAVDAPPADLRPCGLCHSQ